MRVKITLGSETVFANLRETPTAKKVVEALPIESSSQTWGEEVYFETSVASSLEQDAEQVVDPGTVCFWVEGSAMAIPFGATPVSQGRECRLVTKCNLLGQIEGDPRVLGSVRDGDKVRVERV